MRHQHRCTQQEAGQEQGVGAGLQEEVLGRDGVVFSD